MSTNIYVGNISYRLDDESLKSTFAEFGEVVSAKIITDRETGRSKGFAFVEMSNSSEADAAIEGLNGAEVMGRELRVNVARPRNDNRFFYQNRAFLIFFSYLVKFINFQKLRGPVFHRQHVR